MEQKILLKSFIERYKAYIYKAALENAGISAWIIDKSDSTHMITGSLTARIEVYIMTSQLEDAKRVMSDLEEE